MSKGIKNKGNGEYLMGRNSNDADLCVPTVIRERERKAVGQGDQ